MQKDRFFPLLTQVASHSFHFFFQNVQSLKKHFDAAIKQPFVSSSHSVFFCETEAWLISNNRDDAFLLPECTLNRFDFQCGSRQSAGCIMCTTSGSSSINKFIFKNVQFTCQYLQEYHLVLICVHRRPSVTSMNDLKTALDRLFYELKTRAVKVCLFGDFNIDISASHSFIDHMKKFNLLSLDSEPTTENKTLIDLACCTPCLSVSLLVAENVFNYHKPLVFFIIQSFSIRFFCFSQKLLKTSFEVFCIFLHRS